MQLGVMGKDGKRGGRLEREVESWEGNVRGKRAGYREKVKARQSTGTNGDTTFGTVDDDGEGEEEEEPEHDNKRLRIDDEGQEREGSATGEISKSTQKLKLGVNGNRRIQEQDEDDDVEDDIQDDEDSDEQDEDEEDEGQDQDEAQNAEHTLETDDSDSHRRKGTLAPDGRVEVDNSDDDSD